MQRQKLYFRAAGLAALLVLSTGIACALAQTSHPPRASRSTRRGPSMAVRAPARRLRSPTKGRSR